MAKVSPYGYRSDPLESSSSSGLIAIVDMSHEALELLDGVSKFSRMEQNRTTGALHKTFVLYRRIARS